MAESPNALPPLLLVMLDEGRWPRDEHEANSQHSRPWVTRERVAAATQGDEGREGDPSPLFLDPPPFSSVAERVTKKGGEAEFWQDFADPTGIVFARTVVIGDFGLGSDAPIVLDYRGSAEHPRVLRLSYRVAGEAGMRPRPQWVLFAETFDDFVAVLGL